MPAPQVVERPANDRSGWGMLGIALASLLLSFVAFGTLIALSGEGAAVLVPLAVLLFLFTLVLLCGLTAVAPARPG